jgi:hypothetical protein
MSGQVTRADKARSDYMAIPFLAPAGVNRLEVRYEVSDAMSAAQHEESGNVIDIGILDPRGSDPFQAQGFRGWSGSARASFYISATEATPGYLPGPIYPGQWQVVLGLYRIAVQGCTYQVQITLHAGPSAEARPAKISPAISGRPGWYPGDLHAHTEHSDAKGAIADLVKAAQARGLQFVAVTDHNTVSHHAHLATHNTPDFLLIPGQEITTYYGHANAWGAGWQEFRLRTADEMRRVREAVRAAGGLFSINHPKKNEWQYEMFDADCLEVWQMPWFLGNHESLALWERLLRQGQRIVAVGGSDRHQPPFAGELGMYDVGAPTTWVYAQELSERGVLEGLRAGRVFISEGIQGPRIYLEADGDGDGQYEAMMGDALSLPAGREIAWRCRVEGGKGQLLHLVYANAEKCVTVDNDMFIFEWRAAFSHSDYCRAELILPDREETNLAILMRTALSNPIYLSIS